MLKILRRFRLRTVLILAILFVITGGGIVSSVVVIELIGNTILTHAQNRVGQDMNAAWVIYGHELEDMSIIVRTASAYQRITEGLRKGIPNADTHPNEVESWMQTLMRQYDLDLLTLTDKNGVVVARSAPPYNKGDIRRNNPLVQRALEGEVVSSTEIIPREELAIEAEGLGRRAFMVVERTPKAKERLYTAETSGMMLLAASPVKDLNGNILGVLYAGKLLNRNYEIVDRIKDTVYKGETYRGKDVGASTIFQGDLRISTNIRKKNGQRAIGTLISAEVYDQVLENGRPWLGRAFVVKDWYISSYDPIRSMSGETIGIIHVGTLEQKYLDVRNRVIGTFLAIIVFGSAIGIFFSYHISNTVGKPIRRLVLATEELRQGHLSHRIHFTSFMELEQLAESFNDMSRQLDHTMKDMEIANEEISDLNHRYVEMLGFVTHELMHPLGILKGYLIMLLDGSLGPLDERQAGTLDIMRRNVETVINMARKYLHLSLIERGELELKRKNVKLFDDIVFPIVQDERSTLRINVMSLEIEGGDEMKDVVINADPTLLRIVFNNLLQNALKYGRKGGGITIGFRDEGAAFRFNVKNEGPGIPPDKLETIFGKFKRLERDVAGGIKGTGLGLFNSREIIEKHGGRMWAESVEGEYADFIFTLPKNVPETQPDTKNP